MNVLVLIIYIWLIVIAWMMGTRLIRWYVNTKQGKTPYLKEHDYTANALNQIIAVFWQYRIMKRSLVCNMKVELASVAHAPVNTRHPTINGANAPIIRDEQVMNHEEYWTNATKEEINTRGYKPVERLHDSIWWVFVPRYLQIAGAVQFEVPDTIDPKTGKYVYPQHTPSIMADRFQSKASDRFRKMLSKQGARTLDLHTMAMLMILAIGAIFGLFMMGII